MRSPSNIHDRICTEWHLLYSEKLKAYTCVHHHVCIILVSDDYTTLYSIGWWWRHQIETFSAFLAICAENVMLYIQKVTPQVCHVYKVRWLHYVICAPWHVKPPEAQQFLSWLGNWSEITSHSFLLGALTTFWYMNKTATILHFKTHFL